MRRISDRGVQILEEALLICVSLLLLGVLGHFILTSISSTNSFLEALSQQIVNGIDAYFGWLYKPP